MSEFITINKKVLEKIHQQTGLINFNGVIDFSTKRTVAQKLESFFGGHVREYVAMRYFNYTPGEIKQWYKEIPTKGRFPYDMLRDDIKYEVKPYYYAGKTSFGRNTGYLKNPQFDFIILVEMEDRIIPNDRDIKGRVYSIVPVDEYLKHKIIIKTGFKYDEVDLPQSIKDKYRV